MNVIIFLSLSILGCSDKSLGTNDSSEESEQQEIKNIEKLFEIPERPFDLAQHPDGRIFISGDASGKLYTWDDDELREEAGTYDDIQAIHFFENELYYTITDNGVTGALIRGMGNSQETLITQSSDNTLLRWPVDLITTPEGDFLIADFNAGVVFSVSPSGETRIFTGGSSTPEALCWLDGYLYIGGEDGIWKKEWPDGIPTQVDIRPAIALVAVKEQIYAVNPSDGLFPIEGKALLLSELARPGSLLLASDVLYIVDRIGRGVWASTIEED